ncbi:MAG TPA: NAD-dependent epimerase/dehydratase family protein, partial [Candidatus Baltobacteraceae bacterium]|nr:NAD-dependent epimerase/dehydratase family protein [Candidatus Baltobacteraceae bacterium]
MNVLILGGTRFVGRHIADALTERGDGVTLFNRGSHKDVHADLEQVHGDRKHELPRLDGRSWDAVVDVCGYTPDVVETSARYFETRAKRYVFISTLSVYDHERTDGPNEDSPLMRLAQGADPAVYSDENYGALKALCEGEVRQVFGDRAIVLRPGLIVGPFDPTDRFTYWPLRFDEGGDVLAPPAETRVRYIDARDLASFVAHLIEGSGSGTFNCVTPPGSVTFGTVAEACMAEASAEDARAVWVSEEFLALNDVQPWSELPLWIPESSTFGRLNNVDSSRALAAGLA